MVHSPMPMHSSSTSLDIHYQYILRYEEGCLQFLQFLQSRREENIKSAHSLISKIIARAFHLPMVGCCLTPMTSRTYSEDLLVSLENAECVRLPKLLKHEFSVSYRDCLFFSTPADPHGVVFIRKSDHTFLLYRPSRKRFAEYEWKGAVASNTIFFNGKLYAFCKDWSLAVLDPLFPVESCGEILMVRIMRQPGHSPSCEVFRADLTAMEWVKLEDIGDSTLYLSKTSAISVCASEVGSCKGNHIYYLPRAIEGGFHTSRGSYMDFELGSRDGLTIHSVPHNPADGFDFILAGAWVTPCLPEFQTPSV